MSWAKLDDAMLDNEKILAAGTLGFALHVAAMLYCARNLTDGFVPSAKVATLLDFTGLRATHGDILERLVRQRLWHLAGTPCARCLVAHPDTTRDGYLVHDFLVYNPSRAEVLRDREAARVRQGLRRKSRRDIQRDVAEDITRDAGGGHAETSAAPVPVPVPVPDASSEASESAARARELRIPATPSHGRSPLPMRCPRDLETTSGMLAAFRAIGCLDPEAEARLYVATFSAGGRKDIDWTEEGTSFQSYLARHDQKGCAAAKRAPAGAAQAKQDRTLAAMGRLATGGRP